jgi:signal transduction histidine kinase/CheY-like chemotaxis protein
VHVRRGEPRPDPWTDRLLAPSLRAEPSGAGRARVLVGVALAFVALASLVALVGFSEGDEGLYVVAGMQVAVPVAVLATLRWAGSLRVAVHAMAVGIGAACVTYSALLGGFAPSLVIWLSLLPVIVQLTLGWPDARPWIAGSTLGVTLLFVVDLARVLPPVVELSAAVEALNVGIFLFVALLLLRLHDRTHTTTLAELRAAREAAESADDAKTALLAHISHELRTPLHGLVGASQLLATSEDLLERAELGALVKTSGEALAAIVRDVLDLSRIEAGAFRVRAHPFSPREVVEAATVLSATAAQQRGLELRCDLATDVPTSVRGDEARVRQIMINLLDNAIKYTDEGSVVMRVEWRDDELHVSVTDTGVGIAVTEQEHIFEPFQRAGETSDRDVGLGLGLSICRRLAEAMGGRLTLASEPGAGSTFTLSVPAPAAPVSSERSAEALPSNTVGALHVLLVEDDATSRAVVTRIVQRLGHTCKATPTAEDALTALGQEDFDAILMDCRLPDMSGLDATRAIRAGDGKLADIPVIALTANAIEGDEARCLAAGMDAYLTKPLDVAKLEEALARTRPTFRSVSAASG